MLERFVRAKKREINRLRQLENVGLAPEPFTGERPSFVSALAATGTAPVRVIAEYKRASPSRGDIALGLAPEDVAAEYVANGADCLSVLTEELFFKGNIRFLSRMANVGLPLLRKDFIMDPLQVQATAATPASAMLLIVRLTPDVKLLRDLREQAESFGIEAVVEVLDDADMRLARESGAKIVQVNARDLDTLQVDRRACLRMAERFHTAHDGEVWIAASGIDQPAHLQEAADAGYQAVLVGTALMRDGRPGQALAALLQREVVTVTKPGATPAPAAGMTGSGIGPACTRGCHPFGRAFGKIA